MPSKLAGLSQKALKIRKQLGQSYKNTITKELLRIDTEQARVDSFLSTNPNVKSLYPLSALSVSDLQEYQRVLGIIMLQIEGVAMGYKTDLKRIDAELMKRNP